MKKSIGLIQIIIKTEDFLKSGNLLETDASELSLCANMQEL